VSATREAWHELTNSAYIRQKIAECRKLYAAGDTKGYNAAKKSLGCWCFMCTFVENNGSKDDKPLGVWRTQKAAKLNGLIMHDFDKLSHIGLTVNDIYDALPTHWFDDKSCDSAILLAHITPSGDGLRLVTIANEGMTIEQNQLALLTQVKALNPEKFKNLETDGSCINADRTSFVVDSDSVLFINETIFDYDNEKYDEKWGAKYRTHPRPLPIKGGEKRKVDAVNAPLPKQGGAGGESGGDGGESGPSFAQFYHDVSYLALINTWFEQNGGLPKEGDRHKTLLKLCSDLRYITDNDASFIFDVLQRTDFVKNLINNEGREDEIKRICEDVTAKELWWGTPKRLKAVLDALGLGKTAKTVADGVATDEEVLEVFRSFNDRLEPLMTEPYIWAAKTTTQTNLLPAVFASGAMFCTLMTRCWYEHYDGIMTRLNPTAMFIGPPACGKSFVDRLDRQIMAAMKTADAPGRQAEKDYKKKRNERATSSKAQKGEPLEQPQEMIRYLPSKTSNNIFFRRSENAKEIIGGELMHLHLYMFDSELDSAVNAQKSDWAGKHDLELKAFHNEFSGVDFANTDSANDLIQIFWNQVITGTPVSLAKKFNPRNINDGFCTRVSICKIWPEKYKMLERRKSESNYTIDGKLKEWGFRFDGMQGELPIQPLVDHCYDLCEGYAQEAGEADDDVLDLLRKRAVYYAIWYTIPRIYGRQWEQYRETGKIEINDDDLKFASIIYEAVIYWQDFFFGRMLQETWDAAANETQQRTRKSKANDEFALLPQEFTVDDVERVANLSYNAATKRINRWVSAAYVQLKTRSKKAIYEKKVNAIVV
jgi:hypothetical protein